MKKKAKLNKLLFPKSALGDTITALRKAAKETIFEPVLDPFHIWVVDTSLEKRIVEVITQLLKYLPCADETPTDCGLGIHAAAKRLLSDLKELGIHRDYLLEQRKEK